MLEILKYILPALIVLLCSWIVMHMMLKEERERRDFALRKETKKEITPIRLRGYERLSLVLERTTPQHMLRDLDVANLTVRELQTLLIKTVRMEFDHNLSQQIYVSDMTWDAVVLAQEEMIHFINAGAAQYPANASALQYAQQMIVAYDSNGLTPTQAAQNRLREEARELMR